MKGFIFFVEGAYNYNHFVNRLTLHCFEVVSPINKNDTHLQR